MRPWYIWKKKHVWRFVIAVCRRTLTAKPYLRAYNRGDCIHFHLHGSLNNQVYLNTSTSFIIYIYIIFVCWRMWRRTVNRNAWGVCAWQAVISMSTCNNADQHRQCIHHQAMAMIHSTQKRLLHPGMMCLFCDYFISPRGLRTGCLV